MLRKILEKVFNSKKFTNCKTSLTLTIDVSEIPDNKNIGKLFPNYELLFVDQTNSSSDPSQILTQQFSSSSCIPHHLCQILLKPTETPLQHNPHYVLRRFPYFVVLHLTTRHHKYWIYQTICEAKSIKFVIKLFTDHNTLLVKQAIHQKTESEYFRAASLSNLDKTVSNSSIFNTKHTEFSTRW